MTRSKSVYIYALCDPLSGMPRYVGKTCNPTNRLYSHIAQARNEESRKSLWLNNLKRLNVKPIMIILETVSSSLADEAEEKWILEYRTKYPLTNSRIGKIHVSKRPSRCASRTFRLLYSATKRKIETVIGRSILDATPYGGTLLEVLPYGCKKAPARRS